MDDPQTFEEIVQWAFNTLPQKIRDLPDFPGIQVVDEPPAEGLAGLSKRKRWRRGTELLGLYSGIRRIARQHNSVRLQPDVIFVFRGPILRCSKGDLPAEVKQVVWHEVAHWLGHNEDEVKELGLSLGAEGVANHTIETEAVKTVVPQQLWDTPDEVEDAEGQQLRCLKCYSADLTCREFDKPMKSYGAWLSDPLPVHSKIWTCESCGYEWDDDNNTISG